MKMFGIKKGFSLLELILALGIGSAIALIKFQDMKVEQEDLVAKTAGEQIKQLGEAVNGYISMRYDKLSTLTSSVIKVAIRDQEPVILQAVKLITILLLMRDYYLHHITGITYISLPIKLYLNVKEPHLTMLLTV
ncbi:PilV-like protein [Klebsiella pneumoniae]|nr:PilV-like protein [Klebsiella pneumoniae]